jgi:hypothetical protein
MQLSQKYGIRTITNQRSRGIASDWSFAYNSIDTQYVTLAHQDDLYHPEYTDECLSLAERYPDTLITFTDYIELFDNNQRGLTVNMAVKKGILLMFYPFSRRLTSHTLRRRMLALGSPIPCPSVMFNRARIGGFDFSDDFSVNMDWEAWIRLSHMAGSFLYVNKKLMTHRIHGESQTSKGIANETRQREDNVLFGRLWPRVIANALSRLYSLSYISNR